MRVLRRTIDYLGTITPLNQDNVEILAADLCGIFTPEAIESLDPAAIRAMFQTKYQLSYLQQVELGILTVASSRLKNNRSFH
jgi:hypothetical protein